MMNRIVRAYERDFENLMFSRVLATDYERFDRVKIMPLHKQFKNYIAVSDILLQVDIVFLDSLDILAK